MKQQFILNVGEQVWVAGLHWLAAEGLSRRDHRHQARAVGADHYLVHNGQGEKLVGAASLNLTTLNPREKRRAMALAPQLMELLGPDGWAVFSVGTGVFYFVATSAGSLSLLSDITGTHEEILQAVERYQAYYGHDSVRAVYSPFGFLPGLESPEGNLHDILTASTVRKSSRLSPVSSRRPVVLWSVVLLAAFSGWYGINLWQDYRLTQENTARAQALAEARKLVKKDPPTPWKQQPLPDVFIRACSDKWDAPISLAGWLFQTAMCSLDDDGLHLRLAWRRPEGGTLNPFRTRLEDTYPGLKPFFNIPGAADSGGVRIPLTVVNLQERQDGPGDADEITQRLTNYAQQLAAGLTLKEDNTKSVMVDGNLVDLPWRTFSFELQTDIPPNHLFGPDFNSTGIRLSGITMTLINARLHYSLEGKLYAH